MRTLRTVIAVAMTVAAAGLVACGGDDPTPAAGSSGKRGGPDAETRKAMLDFARCMREHGVNMPDPQFGEGGAVIQRSDRGTTPEQNRAAEQACARYRDAIKPPEMSEAEEAEVREQALAYARCMREHGIDMPDPQFGEDGKVTQRIEADRNKGEAELREAEKACRGKMGPIGGAP